MLEKIKKIFRTKWEIIYITQNQSKYFQVIGRLSDNHIEHKTAFDASTINPGRGMGRSTRTYTILVRVEEAYKASNILNEIRH
ncbi:MAG: hypothetical protein CVU84_02125 [Firmicutes bacterium HGW-Firmicutes-1]|nr:MAG: hypothetical protein CVU84_02125 [Firmicutes bacterium HGW-Firmicutes-1]